MFSINITIRRAIYFILGHVPNKIEDSRAQRTLSMSLSGAVFVGALLAILGVEAA